MRLKFLTAAVLFAATAADVSAGPIRDILDNIRERREARQAARKGCGQQCPNAAFQAAPTVQTAAPAVTYTVPGCVGGSCVAPVRVGR